MGVLTVRAHLIRAPNFGQLPYHYQGLQQPLVWSLRDRFMSVTVYTPQVVDFSRRVRFHAPGNMETSHGPIKKG